MSEQQRTGFFLPHGWIYGSLISLNLATATSLAIVAHTTGADALSTVALGLAVLSFVAQLLLAVAQGISANQQFQHVTQVNSAALESLAEIRQATKETIARRDQMFERVLESVIPSAVIESIRDRAGGAESLDVDRLVSSVVQNSRQQLEEIDRSGGTSAPIGPTRTQIDRLISKFPEVESAFRALSGAEQAGFWHQIIQAWSTILTTPEPALESFLAGQLEAARRAERLPGQPIR